MIAFSNALNNLPDGAIAFILKVLESMQSMFLDYLASLSVGVTNGPQVLGCHAECCVNKVWAGFRQKWYTQLDKFLFIQG